MPAKVLLRAWRASDVTSCVALANNEAVHRYMRDAFPYPYTEKDAISFIERAGDPLADGVDPRGNGGLVALAITELDNGELLGGIGLHIDSDIRSHCAEIGYWIGEPYWGRGVGSEAVRLMLQLATQRWGVHRFETTVIKENVASIAVLRKNGFEVEAQCVQRAYRKNGVFFDGVALAFLTPALRARQLSGGPSPVVPRKPCSEPKLPEGAVTLRAHASTDLDELHRLADDPEVHRYTSNRFPYPFSREQAKSWLEKQMAENPLNRAFAVLVNGQFAGSGGIYRKTDIEGHIAVIGYWIGTDFSGRGVATQLISLLVCAAEQFPPNNDGTAAIRKLHALVMKPNVASAVALLKNGFQLEVTTKCGADKNGFLEDECLYTRCLG